MTEIERVKRKLRKATLFEVKYWNKFSQSYKSSACPFGNCSFDPIKTERGRKNFECCQAWFDIVHNFPFLKYCPCHIIGIDEVSEWVDWQIKEDENNG